MFLFQRSLGHRDTSRLNIFTRSADTMDSRQTTRLVISGGIPCFAILALIVGGGGVHVCACR